MMAGGRFGMAVLLAWLLAGSAVHGRTSAGTPDKWNPPPPAPAGGLMDDGGLFNRNPSIGKRIEERLLELHRKHGYRIHLVIEPVLMTAAPPDLAEKLRQTWLPHGDGLVIVYESDTRKLGIGRDLAGMEPTDPGIRVPTHESAAIIDGAILATDKALASDVYLEALAGRLVDGFERHFEQRSDPPPREYSRRLALLVIGGLALLGLCAIAVGALARLHQARSARTFHFQPVDCPERLGAPGGASVTTRSFRPSGRA